VPQFAGLVWGVHMESDGLHIRLTSRKLALQEQRLDGDGTLNVTPVENIVSLLRGGGVAAHEMNIAGYTPGPIEAWEVTVPVDGIRLSAATEIGTVRLLPDSERPILPVGLGRSVTFSMGRMCGRGRSSRRPRIRRGVIWQ
jgi:hypothetical protein